MSTVDKKLERIRRIVSVKVDPDYPTECAITPLFFCHAAAVAAHIALLNAGFHSTFMQRRGKTYLIVDLTG